MKYRVIHHPTGERFAAFASDQLGHAVAVALDLYTWLGEQFVVVSATADQVLYSTPPNAKEPAS